MTGWLVARFGAKRVMTLGILNFSIATLLCGLAQSLDTLVVWRIVQGATGAPVVPLSQTILLNTFSRRQHPMVLSMFGMAVGVAPLVGPVLGGYLAEAYTWRWAFHMLVPVGILAYLGLAWLCPPTADRAPLSSTGRGFWRSPRPWRPCNWSLPVAFGLIGLAPPRSCSSV